MSAGRLGAAIAPESEDTRLIDRAGPVESAGTSRHASEARTALAVGVVVLVVGAVAYRLWLTLGPLGRTPNSDEMIVGLMALHLLRHHEVHAFYWGQTYGGSLESMLVAPFVWLFGTTTLGLRFASVLLGLLAPWLIWRIARHLFAERVALWAAMLALWWPLTLIYFGTQERGFYPLSAALGLTTVLMAVNIDEDPQRVRYWLGVGFAAGVGWWVSPNLIYYAIPVAVWLVLHGHWRRGRNIAFAAGMFVLGSSVWIVANMHTGGASLQTPAGMGGTSTYWSRFGFFWRTGLPFALGLRQPWGGHWYWGPGVGRVLYAAVLIAVVLGARAAIRNLSIDLVLLAIAPFVFASFQSTWSLSEGRYSYFLASLLPLVFCRVMQSKWGRAFVLFLVVVTGIAFTRDYYRLERPIAASVVPVTRAIEHDGYHTAIANYWIAFRMTYQSREHVIASDLPGAFGVRYPPYLDIINGSTPAYVFDLRGPDSNDATLVHALDAAHIKYRIVREGAYYAILPARRLITQP
jgi:uncharacterized membrane protein